MSQENSTIPTFNNQYICIADWMQSELSAVVSSYLHQSGKFLCVFEFPSVSIEKPKEYSEIIDEHYISRITGEEQSIRIHNGIKKIGSLEYLVLIGLNEKQKSYLTYLKEYNVLEINSFSDIETCFGAINCETNQSLSVKPCDTLMGLLVAGRNNLKLKIDNTAKAINDDFRKNNGLLLIENTKTVSVVSAINFALSADLDVKIINPLNESEDVKFTDQIKDWKDGNKDNYKEWHAKLYSINEEINFSDYKFVTFFTAGAPYSIIFKNQIPCSYVHLNMHPTLLIVDCIFYETQHPIGSSVIFSPLEFGLDDETVFASNAFSKNNYFVKKLIGKNATANNIDMHLKEYPFDFFHICSHGGEVDGYSVTKKFIDRNGFKHVVEYDEIISFQHERGEKKVRVIHKYLWRKFNGFIWKSKELKEQKYSEFVFVDMLNSVSMKGNSKKKFNGVYKTNIHGSCAIKCSDFNYQAMFNNIASAHAAPIVFNNTCWSWSGIADSFLKSGVRGYIGTLWAINNKVAIEGAETFYENMFSSSIMEAVYAANKKTKGTDSEDVYIYWGVHFTTMKKGESDKNSKINIAARLLDSRHRWILKANKLPAGEAKDESIRLSEWNLKELLNNFLQESRILFEEFKSNQTRKI